MTAATVKMEQFGRDHWSTFAYLETRVVDADGEVDPIRMRTDPERHPQYIRGSMAVAFHIVDKKKYPTRLAGGVELPDHDDWDCMDDLEAAGLLVVGGTGMFPVVSLTDEGYRVAAQLRKHRSTKPTTGSAYETFHPELLSGSSPSHGASR